MVASTGLHESNRSDMHSAFSEEIRETLSGMGEVDRGSMGGRMIGRHDILLAEVLFAEPDQHGDIAALRGFKLEPANRDFAFQSAPDERGKEVGVLLLAVDGPNVNPKPGGDLLLSEVHHS